MLKGVLHSLKKVKKMKKNAICSNFLLQEMFLTVVFLQQKTIQWDEDTFTLYVVPGIYKP